MLPKFNELTYARRGEPCQEYPGQWLLYTNGNNETPFPTLEEAKAAGDKILNDWDDQASEVDPDILTFPRVTICWRCSDDDPRMGKVWFTGFYKHGAFNLFGFYIET
jgi:hypothetical protein